MVEEERNNNIILLLLLLAMIVILPKSIWAEYNVLHKKDHKINKPTTQCPSIVRRAGILRQFGAAPGAPAAAAEPSLYTAPISDFGDYVESKS